MYYQELMNLLQKMLLENKNCYREFLNVLQKVLSDDDEHFVDFRELDLNEEEIKLLEENNLKHFKTILLQVLYTNVKAVNSYIDVRERHRKGQNGKNNI